MTITTEDCKAFIEEQAGARQLPTSGWKRKSKTKHTAGALREFEHPQGHKIWVLEDKQENLSWVDDPLALNGINSAKVDTSPATSVASSGVASPKAASGSSKEAAFKAASEMEKAAMLWVDFQCTIGGKPPVFTEALHVIKSVDIEDDCPTLTKKKPISWSKVAEEWSDYDDIRDEIYEYMHQLTQMCANDPGAQSIYMPYVGWTFNNDTDYLEKAGYETAPFSADLCGFGLDCSEEELGSYPHPFDNLNLISRDMEGVWSHNKEFGSGVEAMNALYEDLTNLGAVYDTKTQERLQMCADEDETNLLYKKVFEIIGPLIAKKEQELLDAATLSSNPGALPAKKPAISI